MAGGAMTPRQDGIPIRISTSPSREYDIAPSPQGRRNKHLIQAHFAMEDVSAGDAEPLFQIPGRSVLTLDDTRTDIWQ